MKVHNFRDLKVWQKGIQLAKSIYVLTSSFPAEEKYGLMSQMQRCVNSIPSNIAEGCGRTGNNELKYFLSIALGSSFELETQTILAGELDILTMKKLTKQLIKYKKYKRCSLDFIIR